MKKLVLNSELKEFSNLLADGFGNSFSSLLGKNYEFTVLDVNEGELNDIALEFMGQTIVVLKETVGDIFGGLLAQTQIITGFADLMLMGSGEGVSELNDDLKDAIKELINQTISSINTPFYEKFGKKVSFSALNVEHLMDTSSYPGEIIVFDIKSSYGETLKVYFGKKLKSFISAEEEYENDDFDFSQEVTALNEISKTQKSHGGNKNIDLLLDVEVPVSIRIGSTRMFLKDIVSLSPGNIVELDEYAEEPVVVLVNNKPIAKGEVVIVDGYFGVRIKEIISKEERIKKLRD